MLSGGRTTELAFVHPCWQPGDVMHWHGRAYHCVEVEAVEPAVFGTAQMTHWAMRCAFCGRVDRFIAGSDFRPQPFCEPCLGAYSREALELRCPAADRTIQFVPAKARPAREAA